MFRHQLPLIFQRHRPEELGLEVDGDRSSNANTKLSDSVNLNTRIVDQYWYDKEWTLSTAMRTGKFWWLIVSFSTALYAWYAVQVHQTKYLIDVGVSAEFAAFALGLVGLTGVIGQISLGAFSDKFGREIAWTIALMGFLLTYACLFLIKFFPSMTLIYLMVGLQGFIGYGLASVFGSVPADLFSGKPALQSQAHLVELLLAKKSLAVHIEHVEGLQEFSFIFGALQLGRHKVQELAVVDRAIIVGINIINNLSELLLGRIESQLFQHISKFT